MISGLPAYSLVLQTVDIALEGTIPTLSAYVIGNDMFAASFGMEASLESFPLDPVDGKGSRPCQGSRTAGLDGWMNALVFCCSMWCRKRCVAAWLVFRVSFSRAATAAIASKRRRWPSLWFSIADPRAMVMMMMCVCVCVCVSLLSRCHSTVLWVHPSRHIRGSRRRYVTWMHPYHSRYTHVCRVYAL